MSPIVVPRVGDPQQSNAASPFKYTAHIAIHKLSFKDLGLKPPKSIVDGNNNLRLDLSGFRDF